MNNFHDISLYHFQFQSRGWSGNRNPTVPSYKEKYLCQDTSSRIIAKGEPVDVRDVVDVHVDGIHRKRGMMYRNKINFAQPRLPNRPSSVRPSVRLHRSERILFMPVELAWNTNSGGETGERNNIRSHVRVSTCTDTCSLETRGATWDSVVVPRAGIERGRCASRITRSKRGDDSRCRYVTTISVNNGRPTTRPKPYTLRSRRAGIKEGDVLIRQNPILFIRSFDQIAREIVRGLKMDCVRGIVVTIFPSTIISEMPFEETFREKGKLRREGESFLSLKWSL